MVQCKDGCVAVLPCGARRSKPKGAEPEAVPKSEEPEIAPVEAAEGGAEGEKDATSDLELLEKYSKLRASGQNEEAIQLFADDAQWVTLYKTALAGKEEIRVWMDREKEKGRKNLTEGPWKEDGDVYSRELTTKFPRGGLHEVVQSVTVSGGIIVEVRIAPKWKAHAVVIEFACARERDDDKAALAEMAANVVWKTWDNVEVSGKEAVAELMSKQREHNEKREGTSDFEALGEVTDELGIFERAMEIERSDGIKVCGTQTLRVRGNPLKIDEIYVHPEVEMKGGLWQTPIERERSTKYHTPGEGESAPMTGGKGKPKCGCAVM